MGDVSASTNLIRMNNPGLTKAVISQILKQRVDENWRETKNTMLNEKFSLYC